MRKHRLCRDSAEAIATGHLPTCLRETFFLSHLTQMHQYMLFFNPSIEKINSKQQVMEKKVEAALPGLVYLLASDFLPKQRKIKLLVSLLE